MIVVAPFLFSRLVELRAHDGGTTTVDYDKVAAIVVSRRAEKPGSAIFLQGVATVLQVEGTPEEVRSSMESQVRAAFDAAQLEYDGGTAGASAFGGAP